MVTSNYPCSQSALYQIGRNVAASLTQYQANFVSFKPRYTPLFITQFGDEITAAELLPDFQARSAQSEVDYINLTATLYTCTDKWQSLKRYILTAFSPAEQKPRLEEAGALHYERALAKNWDEAKALLTSAVNFTTLHQSTLEAGLNMPPTFLGELEAQNISFNENLLLFQQSEEAVKVGTANKINTNNAIYANIMQICLDGQIIFKAQPEIKDQFTFTAIHQIVSGTGTTGFKGYIINAPINQPIVGATITTTPPTKTVTTNAEGFYEMIQIPNGIYTIQVSAVGFQPQSISNYQVDTGITHNLSIPLQPLP